ncbi:MAG: amidohydrolase family protein [Porticoccaceae bacterium]|nr:amidohydrolase family protein [Porticoccaceae bacterium]
MIGIKERCFTFVTIYLFKAAALMVTPTVYAADVYDVIIKNGRVLDGAGNPWIKADIAIKSGRFAKVGIVNGTSKKIIDASGKYVSPGFIDIMDQSGRVLLTNGLAENKLLMGVTSLIAGEGGTPVPVDDIPAYFNSLETRGISVNFGSFFNISQARIPVLGETDASPTQSQLLEMQLIVDKAMRAGVMGLSSALIYPPDAYASTSDIIEMAKAIAPYGGVYASHIRSEGRDLIEGINEFIEICEKAGVRGELFHIKNAYAPNWGKAVHIAIDTINAARARGVDVAADQYPYVAGGTGLDATLPKWIFANGLDKALVEIMKPEVRVKMKQEIMDPASDSLVVASGGWKGVVLANSHLDEYRKFHNMNFEDIGAALGRDPADVSWDIFVKAASLRVGSGNNSRGPENMGGKRAMALFFMMTEHDVQTFMKQPWVAIGSDAGAASELGAIDILGLPHPRSYGTFARIIAKYHKETGILTLADAVRKMTSWPAARMRLKDRGTIQEGLWADAVIFDLETIKDNATWNNPVSTPNGISHVLVNGTLTIENGVHTGARSGKVLYGGGKQ